MRLSCPFSLLYLNCCNRKTAGGSECITEKISSAACMKLIDSRMIRLAYRVVRTKQRAVEIDALQP